MMFINKLITRINTRLLLLKFHLSCTLQYNNFFFFQFLYYYSTKMTIINLYFAIFSLKKLFPMFIFFLKNSGLLLLFDFLNLNFFFKKSIYFSKKIQLYQNWSIGTFDNPVIFSFILQQFFVVFEFLKVFIIFFTIPKTKMVLLSKLWKFNLPIIAFLNSNLLFQYIYYIIPLIMQTELQTFFFIYFFQILFKYFFFIDLHNNIIKNTRKLIFFAKKKKIYKRINLLIKKRLHSGKSFYSIKKPLYSRRSIYSPFRYEKPFFIKKKICYPFPRRKSFFFKNKKPFHFTNKKSVFLNFNNNNKRFFRTKKPFYFKK